MYENRSITAIIIGVVSLMLIGAAWFYLGRNPNSARAGKTPTRRSDPYSSYYRDAGQIADSLSTPNLSPPPAPTAGNPAAQPIPGQPAPTQSIPGQPASAQPTPGQPVSGQAPSGQPTSSQAIPAQPVPGLVPASQPGFQPAAAPPTTPSLQPNALPPDMPPPTMLRR